MFNILCLEPAELCDREPECFRDLNLDRFLEPVLNQENRIPLAPWFNTPLLEEAQVQYRQAILKDLQRGDNLQLLDVFSREIYSLSEKEQKAIEDLNSGDPWRCHNYLYGHILHYGERYVSCVRDLCRKLPDLGLSSQGLRQAGELLRKLQDSPFFQNMASAQASLREKLNGIQYVMQIRYGTVRIKKYEGEEDLSRKITAVFQKFQGENPHDYRQELKEEPYADHVEAGVHQCLSRLYPREFEELGEYVKNFSEFMDEGLLNFCREIRFYVDWLLAIAPLQSQGLPFCFPEFDGSDFQGTDFYDLMLAKQIGRAVVRNDFRLEPGEQILVVTGPNQGGKTTFARSLGQLHYLASLGLCVPGTSARLQLTDQVLTHFGKEKSELRGSGRLQDDLQRLHEILGLATERSFLVINEIFASTSAQDGGKLGRKMLDMILERGSSAVLVTFLSELASLGPETVSMMSTVDPENPECRSFRILRKPADRITYAMTLAEKHGLTYEQIMRRMGK